jgi:hypothetical protein
MALGTVAVVPQITKAGGPALNGGNSASDPYYVEEVTVVGDTSYPTGGSIGLDTAYQAIDAAHSMRTIIAVHTIDAFGYGVGWDSTNKKLKFYSSGAEVTSTTNLSGVTFKLLLISR